MTAITNNKTYIELKTYSDKSGVMNTPHETRAYKVTPIQSLKHLESSLRYMATAATMLSIMAASMLGLGNVAMLFLKLASKNSSL